MNCFVRRNARTRTAVLGILLLLGAQGMVACAPVLLGTGVVTAINVVNERRSFGRAFDDNSLELELRAEMRTDEQLKPNNISVTAINGIVLLTGEVASDEMRQRAEALAKANKKTRTVVNELQLAGSTSLTSRLNDTYITARVKTYLIGTKGLPQNAVKVVTEGGKVYLMGVVTQAEADAAVQAARKASGATHIVKVFEYIEEE